MKVAKGLLFCTCAPPDAPDARQKQPHPFHGCIKPHTLSRTSPPHLLRAGCSPTARPIALARADAARRALTHLRITIRNSLQRRPHSTTSTTSRLIVLLFGPLFGAVPPWITSLIQARVIIAVGAPSQVDDDQGFVNCAAHCSGRINPTSSHGRGGVTRGVVVGPDQEGDSCDENVPLTRVHSPGANGYVWEDRGFRCRPTSHGHVMLRRTKTVACRVSRIKHWNMLLVWY